MAESGVIRELLVSLGIDSDVDEIVDTTVVFEELEKIMQAVAVAAAAVAAALAAAVAVTVEAGSAAQDGAARTGLTVEAYQELAYAAQQCGVPMEILEASLAKQNRLAAEAAAGNKQAAAAFDALGVSVTNADGSMKSSEQLFNETAAALAKIEDPSKRAAAAQAIYGESAAKLLPLLSQGADGIDAMRAEAEALGIVLSDEDVAAADQFGDSMDMLQGILRGLAFDIGTALLPFLQTAVDGFKAWYLANRELIGKGLSVMATVIGGFVRLLVQVFDVIDRVVESTIGWDAVFKGLAAVASVVTVAILGIGSALAGLLAGVLSITSALGLFFGIVSGFLPLVAIFTTIAAAIGGVVLVVEDLYTYFQGGDSLIGRLIAQLQILLDQWRQQEGALGTAIRLFDALWSLAQALYGAFEAVAHVVGDVLGAAFDALLVKMQPVIDFVARMGAIIGSTFTLIREVITSAIDAVLPYIEKLTGGIGAVTGAINALTGGGGEAATAAPGGAQGAFSAAGGTSGASSAVGAPVAPGGAGTGGGSTSATMANSYTINGAGLTQEQVLELIRQTQDADTRELANLSTGAAA